MTKRKREEYRVRKTTRRNYRSPSRRHRNKRDNKDISKRKSNRRDRKRKVPERSLCSHRMNSSEKSKKEKNESDHRRKRNYRRRKHYKIQHHPDLREERKSSVEKKDTKPQTIDLQKRILKPTKPIKRKDFVAKLSEDKNKKEQKSSQYLSEEQESSQKLSNKQKSSHELSDEQKLEEELDKELEKYMKIARKLKPTYLTNTMQVEANDDTDDEVTTNKEMEELMAYGQEVIVSKDDSKPSSQKPQPPSKQQTHISVTQKGTIKERECTELMTDSKKDMDTTKPEEDGDQAISKL
ncbi:unnamed protein product [Moneuplotes crassus]|uniref:Uncharacterized protein n=1 Tax=Euplotes crassus TaxID=5936 RepID=A0AAD2D2L9_EUPCR|nr:unnamed protein product [Moneuplotes crassus]